MQLDDLYREIIMDHYQNPRKRGELPDASVSVGFKNPTCGDVIQMQLKVSPEGTIEDARFLGEGCSISMSASSMMTEALVGKSLTAAEQLAFNMRRMMLHEDVSEDEVGELDALRGVKNFPSRIKCATLSANAVEKALLELKEKGGSADGH